MLAAGIRWTLHSDESVTPIYPLQQLERCEQQGRDRRVRSDERHGLVPLLPEHLGSEVHANAIDLRLELVPDDGDAWLAKAEMLGEHGVGWLRRAIAREPNALAQRVALYGLLGQRKDYAGAVIEIDEALALAAPDQRPRLLHAKAELLCSLERAQEGLEAIDEALLGESGIGRWHYVRGWALGMLGELEQAHAAMRRALELAPDDGPTQRALAQLDQALALD
mgnify:CR=1 FL=1